MARWSGWVTWEDWLARVGARTPSARDAVVSAVLISLSLARLAVPQLGPVGTASTAAVVAMHACAVIDLATISVRRRVPRLALAVATIAVLWAAFLPGRLAFTGVGVVVCAYTVGNLLPRVTAVIAVALACAVHTITALVAVESGGATAGLLTFWGILPGDRWDLVVASVASFGIPTLVGSYVQTRQAYAEEVAARLARMDRECEEQARIAVVEERGRIARELHDIAAHDLSAIVVQAGAADGCSTASPRLSGRCCRRSGCREGTPSPRCAAWSGSCASPMTARPTTATDGPRSRRWPASAG